jgi:predicted MPP superfamily phosphohydrolase
MANTLSWLHLSDLHIEPRTIGGLRLVLDALWKDLPKQIDLVGGKLDFIAFTGDLAFSGKDEEYHLAENEFLIPLLEKTRVPKEFLLIVPGNHDVNREFTRYLNTDILASLDDPEKVIELLSDRKKRERIFSTMPGYVEFIRRFYQDLPNHPILSEPYYSYVQWLGVSEPKIAIIGINSAWLSGCFVDNTKKIIDKGRILVGENQVTDAFKKAEHASIRIALMHHPTSSLAESDAPRVEKILRSGCDFVLQGHLHEPGFNQLKSLISETMTIPAGTVYESSGDKLNGYNFVYIDLDKGKGKVIFRRYSNEQLAWVEDNISTGDKYKGEVNFDLPGRLSKPSTVTSIPPKTILKQKTTNRKTQRKTVRPKSSVPWLQIGRERELQLFEMFFSQHEQKVLLIHGDDDCGLNEFVNQLILFLAKLPCEAILFDAENGNFGIAVDQYYFIQILVGGIRSKSRQGVEIVPDKIDEILGNSLIFINEHCAEKKIRPVFIFSNYDQFNKSIREWIKLKFWKQVQEGLKDCSPLAIYIFKDKLKENESQIEEAAEILLQEFTLQDVEKYLLSSRFTPEQNIKSLSLAIHRGRSGQQKDDKFLVSPKVVYDNFVTKAVKVGWYKKIVKGN